MTVRFYVDVRHYDYTLYAIFYGLLAETITIIIIIILIILG